MADTPTTQAGKRLLERSEDFGGEVFQSRNGWRADIAAIEDEAVAAERARIRREVEALPIDAMCHDYEGRCGCGDPATVMLAAVLAIVDPA